MKKLKVCYLAVFSSLFLIPSSSIAQQLMQNVRGVVKDATSGEVLQGALLKVFNQTDGAVSDDDVSYFISLPLGYHSIEISFLGYQTKFYNEILVSY